MDLVEAPDFDHHDGLGDGGDGEAPKRPVVGACGSGEFNVQLAIGTGRKESQAPPLLSADLHFTGRVALVDRDGLGRVVGPNFAIFDDVAGRGCPRRAGNPGRKDLILLFFLQILDGPFGLVRRRCVFVGLRAAECARLPLGGEREYRRAVEGLIDYR